MPVWDVVTMWSATSANAIQCEAKVKRKILAPPVCLRQEIYAKRKVDEEMFREKVTKM